MSVVTKVIHAFAKTGATGTQDITTSKLGGLTPVGAKIYMTRATVLNTAADHEVLAIGLTDGSAMGCWTGAAEHGVTTADTYTYWSDTKVIAFVDPSGTAATDGLADLTGGGFITNGIRLNWTETPGSAWLIVIKFYAGSETECHFNSRTDITTTPKVITDFGLSGIPQVVHFANTGATAVNTLGNQSRINIGVYDGTTQTVMSRFNRDAGAVSRIAMRIDTDAVAFLLSNAGGTTDMLTVSSLSANGMTLTPGTDWTGLHVGYLAVYLGSSASADAQIYDVPTTAEPFTDTTVSGMGFTPAFGMMLMSKLTVRDIGRTTHEADTFAISVFDEDDEYTISITDDDGETVMDNQSLVTTSNAEWPEAGGSAYFAGTLSAFDSGGWDTDVTLSPNVVLRWFAVGIEEIAPVAGAASLLLMQQSFRQGA